MERRDFLKLCSMTGLTVVVGSALDDQKAEAKPAHTFFINIHFGGGIDTTNFIDPKGAATEAEASAPSPSPAMNHYLTSEIPKDSTSGVSWAPLHLSRELMQQQNTAGADLFNAYMLKEAKNMLVIRGVDYQTNAHDVGSRLAVTGNAMEHSAAFGAIVSGATLPNAPMSFVSFGGYSETNGTAAVTRLGNLDTIKRLAFPYRANPDDENSAYYNDEQAAMIAEAREGRFQALTKAQRLPRVKSAMNTLYLSRLGQNELKQLVSFLPTEVRDGLAGQIQLAGAAYKAGLCMAVSLGAPGGYDHHNDVDNSLNGSYSQSFDPDRGIPGMMDVIDELDLRTKSCITWTADFGRTPGYNDSNGKDHWAVTSVAATGYINGKRIKPGVKGGSTERHEPMGVDPKTGVVKSGSDLTIKSGHINNCLRRLAGVLESEQSIKNQTSTPADELTDLIEVG